MMSSLVRIVHPFHETDDVILNIDNFLDFLDNCRRQDLDVVLSFNVALAIKLTGAFR